MNQARNARPELKKTGRNLFQWIAVLLCSALLTACASTGTGTSATTTSPDTGAESSTSSSTSRTSTSDKRDEVVQRAEARWAAMLDKDLETAYTFYSPGYRSTASVVDFMFKERTRRVKWVSSEYIDHECSGDSCKVRFKAGFEIRQAVPGLDVYEGSDTIEERWVRTEGEWWFLPPQ